MDRDYDHRTVLEFDYDDPTAASVVERSVRPEVGDIDGDRTVVDLDRNGAVVTVTVDAADLVALRAGCTTWLSLLSVAESCAGVEAA